MNKTPHIERPANIDTRFHLGNGDGSMVIERVADVQSILDSAKNLRSNGAGVSESGELHHVGRIPSIIIEKYCNANGISYREFLIDDTHITRILNDPDYKLFRVWEGTV